MLARNGRHRTFGMIVASAYRYFAGICIKIKPGCDSCPAPRCEILKRHHAESVVKAVEMPWIINIMVAVAVVCPNCSIGSAIVVRGSHGSFASCDALVVHIGRFGIRQCGIYRVVGFEIGKGIICVCLPMGAELVTDFSVSSALFEIEPVDISVSPVV